MSPPSKHGEKVGQASCLSRAGWKPALLWLAVVVALLGIISAHGRPNVLLIVVDDLRTELGCYGSTRVKSPNIDRLAARGVRFDRAYCQYPVCNPSRVSFLTGLRPDSTKVLGNDLNFRKVLPDIVTLPQLFRQNGYFTASLGKIFHRGLTMEDLRPEMDDPKSWDAAKYFQATEKGLKGEGRNLTEGRLAWCRWLAAEGGDDDQPDGQIAAAAIKILEEKRDKPFFLAVGFHKPHDPFIAPKKYFEMYPSDQLKLHKDPADTTPTLDIAIARGWLQQFGKFTDQERREYLRAYLACISFMDAQLGKVIDALERLNLAPNTLVVFMGDHGFHLGERGWWNKNTLFELSARPPLIVVAPQAKGNGRTCKRVVEFVDLFPSVVELAGLKAPHALQGRSLVPLLQNPEAPWDEAALTQVQRGKVAGYSIRTQRWRYTEWDGGKAGAELYDHNDDSGEWRNLAADKQYAETIEQLATLLAKTRNP